jgi:hypothetical protein
MLKNYVLIGQTPVEEPDLLTWAQSFSEWRDRRVARTCVLDLCEVSTVFLGTDHNWTFQGPPILFETMAFWPDEGGWEQERCATWIEAEAMHAAMVREAAQPRRVLAFLVRRVKTAAQAAVDDWRERWRELCGIEASEIRKAIAQLREIRERWSR